MDGTTVEAPLTSALRFRLKLKPAMLSREAEEGVGKRDLTGEKKMDGEKGKCIYASYRVMGWG